MLNGKPGSRIVAVILSAALLMGIAPMPAVAADDGIGALGQSSAAEKIVTQIEDWNQEVSGSIGASFSGNTVTVTGSVTDADKPVGSLWLEDRVTVVWEAQTSFTANAGTPVTLYGEGTFELPSGGSIKTPGASAWPSRYTISAIGEDVSLRITGGEVENSVEASAAVNLSSGASMTMTDGTIKSEKSGVIVSPNCTFEMTGGDILSKNAGVNVNSSGLFIMSAGTIESDTTGVYLGGKFELSGGTIEGKSIGVNVYSQEFNMIGGTVKSDDTGISVTTGLFHMTGGRVESQDVGVLINNNGNTSKPRVWNTIIDGGTVQSVNEAIQHVQEGQIQIKSGSVECTGSGHAIVSGDDAATFVMSATNSNMVKSADKVGMDAVDGATVVFWTNPSSTSYIGNSTDDLEVGNADTQANWTNDSEMGAIKVSNSSKRTTFSFPIPSVTVNKIQQTTPVTITNGDITKQYGSARFNLTVSGGDGTGGWSFTSSDPDVATVSAYRSVTLGTGANAIGSTQITAIKLGDGNYNDSQESAPITLTVVKADQAAPTIVEHTQSGNPQTGVTVTITNPDASVAEFSGDGVSWQASNVFTFAPGVDKGDIYVRMKETATHNASPQKHVELDLSRVMVQSITVTGANGADSITQKDGTLQMIATVLPDNADNKAVVWSVNGTAADISGTGLLTAKADGTVTVRATAADGSNVFGEKAIVISGQDTTTPTVPVSSITVTGANGADSITQKDGTLQMVAIVSPDNATDKNVTWSVNGTAASISGTGLLTATADGTVTVRATAADGSNVFGEKAIAISGQDTTTPTVPVSSITVTGANGAHSITQKGGTLQMLADVTPDNADNKAVAWSVNGTAATISGTGLLTAKANGTVTVRATAADGNGAYGEMTISISGQSTSGGSSGGSSGSSKGGSSKADTKTAPRTNGSANAETGTLWINKPQGSGAPSRSGGEAGVKAEDWTKFGNSPVIHDTLEGNSVQVRIRIDNPSQWTKETMVSGYVKGRQVDSVRGLFQQWYGNKLVIIQLDQQADWEHPVSVAAKVDLTGFDTENLVLYSYSSGSNSYRQINSAGYSIDSNGYLRFETPYAGSIVVSEGTLEKR